MSWLGAAVGVFWKLLPVFDAVASRVRRAGKRKPPPEPPKPKAPVGNPRVSVGGGRPPPGLRH